MDLRLARRAVIAAVLVGGPLLMGAEPAPAPQSEIPAEQIAKILPKPRLYLITNTSNGKTDGPSQFCMSGDSILQMLDGLGSLAKDPKLTEGCTRTVDRKPDGAVHIESSCAKGASGFPGGGCTQTIDRDAGGVRIDMTCDKAAGASMPLHMTMQADSELKEMRQRMEMEVGAAPPRTLVSETDTVQAGDCPADLKPGEMRSADGTKTDMSKLFAGPAATPGAAKPSEPH
jgi:hypothetical protein